MTQTYSKKIHDCKIMRETKKLGNYTTTYRIDHFPIIRVGTLYVPTTEPTTVGYGVRQGNKWIILFTDGEVAGTYSTLSKGVWNLVH